MSLKKTLIRHEGLRLKPYRCSAGKLTIGYGRNLEDTGITAAEAMGMLENDIDRCKRELLDAFPWFRYLSQLRKEALINMTFQMGIGGVKKFKKSLKAIENKDWDKAYEELLDSKWAREDTPSRAQEVADMVRRG